MVEYLVVFAVALFATFQASKKKNKVSIVLWSSLAIIVLALFAFIMGNIAGGIVSMILIFSIWILVAIIADNKEEN